MYAEVIPQIRTIPKLGIFDYKISKDLIISRGDIVTVQFRNTEVIGLVYKIKKFSKFKKIKSILFKVDDICLSGDQVNLITWMTKQYGISPALAFKMLMPDIPKKSREKKPLNLESINISINKNRIPEIKLAIKQLSAINKPAILHYNNRNEKNAVLLGLAKNKQVLIVVPEKQDVLDMAKVFYKHNPVQIYSGLSKNQLWQTWQDIKNNKTEVIIGTKNAIFVPPDNIDIIIIDNEEDKSHLNYEQNPKYHVLEIAERLKTKIILTSEAPLISSYQKYNHVDLFGPRNSKISLVNMKEEKNGGNYSYFSLVMQDLVNQHKKSFLLFNRKGDANLLLCNNCREIYPFAGTTKCNNCKSIDMKKISFGTTKIKADLENLFPNKKIIEITKDMQDMQDCKDFDIVIGTEYALRKLDMKAIDFFCLLSADHQLAMPDIMSSERVFQLLTHIININKPVCLQTHSPDNMVIRTALSGDYLKFFKYQVNLRKAFNN